MQEQNKRQGLSNKTKRGDRGVCKTLRDADELNEIQIGNNEN